MKAKATSTPLVQQSAANRRKGTRMLNGRVYGGPKKNNNNNTKANPFANARDEEPEFVEWGYGGMGSVKGARSAGVSSNWERLQGGSAMGGGAKTRLDVGVGGRGTDDVDLDDGSGLAWVKRRKEEKERKAREQKEKEEKEAEKENSESQTNTPIPTRSSTLESIATISSPTSDIEPATHTPPTIDAPPLTIVLEEDGETVIKPGFPTPVPSRYPSELGVSSSSYSQNPLTEEPTNAESKPEEGQLHNSATTHENERILQAITVPVRSPRHHHHRQPSKAGSREVLLTEGSVALPPILISPSPNVGGGDTIVTSKGLLHTSIDTDKATSPTSFSSSFEESSSESEEADDGDGDDEDEDEDEEESQKQSERMKTTLGTAAGVEKISRHKE